MIGFKTVLTRMTWQNWVIVVFCPLLATIFQGVQVDTDHWQHFYWMPGMMRGLSAASVAFQKVRQMREAWTVGDRNERRLVGAAGFEPATPIPPE